MSAPVRFADWDTLQAALSEVVATMRRYLDQLTCLLRPGSVRNTDQVLRSLAMFLAETRHTRCRPSPATCPSRIIPLPKALDDAAAAKLLRAAQE